MIEIEQTSPNNKELFSIAETLVQELVQSSNKTVKFDFERIEEGLSSFSENINCFVAKDGNQIVGLITLQTAFSFYSSGEYGIINELYINPTFRSKGIGKLLLDAVIKFGKSKGWKRIDVTAPAGEQWERSVNFYKKNGFIFTGPKLKYMIG